MHRLVLAFLLLGMIASRGRAAGETDATNGKNPYEEQPENSGPFVPYVTTDLPSNKIPPAPFVNLQNAVDFIRHQRGLQGRGLPATFYTPSSFQLEDPVRQLIISEGVGLYDTALALIALVEAGDLKSAEEILRIYARGVYGREDGVPMELRAIPSQNNGEAFSSFDNETYYFFDFTNVSGNWSRWGARWAFWGAHSGPNAWFINAIARYMQAARRAGQSDSRLKPYQAMAETIGAALIRLQDAEALGGVRYGPKDQYVADGTIEPFEQINSENNLSVYVAFQMLYGLTGNSLYKDAAQRILAWFENAPVWTPDGLPRRGLLDRDTHTLAMGAERHGNRWILQKEHPTDSEGTWAISSLGPETIDRLWGAGTAYQMWRTIRARAGRTSAFKWAQENDVLAGLDYTDAFPENQSLISPEWTTGGLFALRLLISYYERGQGKRQLTAEQIKGLRDDAQTMTAFIRTHSNFYAIGPGLKGTRQGQTGFGWFAPPPDVQAMPSIYFAIYNEGKSDPAAWWRTHPN